MKILALCILALACSSAPKFPMPHELTAEERGVICANLNLLASTPIEDSEVNATRRAAVIGDLKALYLCPSQE